MINKQYKLKFKSTFISLGLIGAGLCVFGALSGDGNEANATNLRRSNSSASASASGGIRRGSSNGNLQNASRQRSLSTSDLHSSSTTTSDLSGERRRRYSESDVGSQYEIQSLLEKMDKGKLTDRDFDRLNYLLDRQEALLGGPIPGINESGVRRTTGNIRYSVDGSGNTTIVDRKGFKTTNSVESDGTQRSVTVDSNGVKTLENVKTRDGHVTTTSFDKDGNMKLTHYLKDRKLYKSESRQQDGGIITKFYDDSEQETSRFYSQD